MPEFLSSDWIAALDARARSSQSFAGVGDLTVQMVVRGAPGGEMTYHVTIEGQAARVRAGSTESPDLTLIADYDVACSISQGVANAQEALTGGRFKVTGRLESLRGQEKALAAIDDVFADVRATTTYPADPARTMPS